MRRANAWNTQLDYWIIRGTKKKQTKQNKKKHTQAMTLIAMVAHKWF